MCDFCRHNPCDPRCPYAPEPAVVYVCSGCGEDVHVGDTYYEIAGDIYCEECIEDAKKEASIDEDY